MKLILTRRTTAIKKGAVTVSRELDSLLCGVKVGFCMTGSFCTFSKAFSAMEALRDAGCDILPVMSLSAGTVDTRFGTAQEHIKRAENICGKRVIMSVADAEPIGPKRLTDIMIVAPCTGNTMAKLARSITDTPVTMAVKATSEEQDLCLSPVRQMMRLQGRLRISDFL